MVTQQTILQAARILGEAAAPARVILFGSYARGEADDDSDLDFLVVTPEVVARHAEAVRLRRALRGLGLAADVLVASESEVAGWATIPGSVLHQAVTEGRVLFDGH